MVRAAEARGAAPGYRRSRVDDMEGAERTPAGEPRPGEPRERDPEEAILAAALRAGDEAAFAILIDRYYGTMLRVARTYVSTREAAEDVVQETFLGVIQGIARFEERSSLRTWMFRILANRAKTRGEREGRTRPFSSLAAEIESDEPAVGPERFVREGRWAGFWSAPPAAAPLPEAGVLATEVRQRVMAAIETLPPAQRAVIDLRDVQGYSAVEVCALLDLTEGNQRVLLHRARAKVRAALERYAGEEALV